MVGNVYSMALWADGGMTMRKPYISGDGYVMKMGNYSRAASARRTKKQNDSQLDSAIGGDARDAGNTKSWNEEWNAVFHHFIDRNATKLLRTYYAGLVRAWQKKPEKEKHDELELANKVIARVS